jgi:flagellar P-ring protein precursor FlgI
MTVVLPHCAEASRIKDLTTIAGDRDNQLIGYGLVVGLAGTGDTNAPYTSSSFQNTLKRFNIESSEVKAKNIAAVMVTADIGPFVKEGSRIDVTVSSVGDCKTLQGGVLLQSPLEGADGVVYAVAQGPIAVGGFLGGGGSEGGGSASVQQNHPTVGRIAGGAIVEREIESNVMHEGGIVLSLRNPDYTSAVRIADAINVAFPGCAMAENMNTVNVHVPEAYAQQEVNFLAALGAIDVAPDLPARVVVNERTGTIVATSEVRLSRVAISHGSLTITVSSTPQVSQPQGLSQTGTTQTTANVQTTVHEQKGVFHIIDEFTTIDRLTSALNALGVSSREMMSILQALKNAGALQADLIVH